MADQFLNTLVSSYIKYFASGDGHTARAKRSDIKHFKKFLLTYRKKGKEEELLLSDWDHGASEAFLKSRVELGEAPATLARRLATLKHFGRIISEQLPGTFNPARGVRQPRLGTALPQHLLPEEQVAVLDKTQENVREKDSFIRFRNMVIVQLLLETGLRADEVRLLKRSQLNEEREWLVNVKTKANQFRNVYLTSHLRSLIDLYLERRRTELRRFFSRLTPATDNALPLFISTYGAKVGSRTSFHLGAKTLYRAVSAASNGAKLHPHLLRHTFAMELLKSSSNVRLVAQALGHSDIKTTMKYTESLDCEVAMAIEKKNCK
jgi:integrase/recombinase XerC